MVVSIYFWSKMGWEMGYCVKKTFKFDLLGTTMTRIWVKSDNVSLPQ